MEIETKSINQSITFVRATGDHWRPTIT